MEKEILCFLLRWLLAGVLLGAESAGAMTGLLAGSEVLPGDRASAYEVWPGDRAETENEVLPGNWGVSESDTLSGDGAETENDALSGDEAAGDEILIKLWESMPVYGGRDKKIGAARIEGTEEDLLTLIYGEMKAWDNVDDSYTQGQIDLSFEGLVLASVECGSARLVFIVLPEGTYRISSAYFHDRDEWKELVQGILETAFADRNLGREQTEDFFCRNIAEEEKYRSLVVLRYRGAYYRFDRYRDQSLLSWERGEEGISFQESYRGIHWEEGDDFSQRAFEFRRVDGPWETESGRAIRERLQELCPGMEDCYIWTQEDDAFFAEAECSETESLGIYGASSVWQREVYQIRCTDPAGENDEPGMERLIWGNTEEVSYYWTCGEDAVLRESDVLQGYYVYQKDIGEGEPYTFLLRRLEEGGESAERGEDEESSFQYDLLVYEEDGEQPFQKLELGEEPISGMFLGFEDYNADGYGDLRIGDGWVEKCYLWSSSQKQYIDMTEALGGFFRYYLVDEEKRQLWVWRQGYCRWAEAVYQWSGEMDCELLKEFYQEYIYDREAGTEWQEVTITVREDGTDRVLTDFIYPCEEYLSRAAEIKEILNLDFVWEQEVAVGQEEIPCILRYAQEETREEDGTVLYTDRLFLFRWDTYLMDSCSGVVSSSPWKKISIDEEGRLSVTYRNGSSVVYSREFYDSFE